MTCSVACGVWFIDATNVRFEGYGSLYPAFPDRYIVPSDILKDVRNFRYNDIFDGWAGCSMRNQDAPRLVNW
jgi:hypothetical protein